LLIGFVEREQRDAPGALAALFIGWARVEENQHYVTDIAGSVAVTAAAASR
jgi:membrane-associated phospholipid phosphatase